MHLHQWCCTISTRRRNVCICYSTHATPPLEVTASCPCLYATVEIESPTSLYILSMRSLLVALKCPGATSWTCKCGEAQPQRPSQRHHASGHRSRGPVAMRNHDARWTLRTSGCVKPTFSRNLPNMPIPTLVESQHQRFLCYMQSCGCKEAPSSCTNDMRRLQQGVCEMFADWCMAMLMSPALRIRNDQLLA